MQQFSPVVTLAHPFCKLAEASLLLGLTYKAAQSRYFDWPSRPPSCQAAER